MNSDERTCLFCSILWKQYNLCNCLAAYAKDCSKNHLTPRIFFLRMKLFYLRLIFLESLTARRSVWSEIGWELDGNASSEGHLKLTVIASSSRTLEVAAQYCGYMCQKLEFLWIDGFHPPSFPDFFSWFKDRKHLASFSNSDGLFGVSSFLFSIWNPTWKDFGGEQTNKANPQTQQANRLILYASSKRGLSNSKQY